MKIALTCRPAPSIADALRMNFLGKVDVPKLLAQHAEYCRWLQEFGYTLYMLPPWEQKADSVFVEDPAIILRNLDPRHAKFVRTKLANPARQGEEDAIEDALVPFFLPDAMFEIFEGTVEGGDVLVAGDELYIGLSKRTSIEGAKDLEDIADRCGMNVTMFPIPSSYLHLKGEATFHPEGLDGEPVITASEEIAPHFAGSVHRLIVTPKDERFGGNCISDGKRILIHKGSDKTKAILAREGYDVIELDLSEFAKIDGAMTCLSKLFVI